MIPEGLHSPINNFIELQLLMNFNIDVLCIVQWLSM
jgi:hypothetical protein